MEPHSVKQHDLRKHDLRKKVRAILERANHANTPQAEAETALALAYRLMQKHGITDADVQQLKPAGHEISPQTFRIKGPYRVRRGWLLHSIATTVNCANYRDQLDTDNTDVVTIVAFGTSDDLFALAALYSTAEMLALRLLPRGDRRFRTSWWRGFTEGVESKLSQERATIVTESPGTGLVLVERATRADHVMRSSTPHLRNSYSSYASDGDAYLAGHAAGSQFNGANNAVRGGTRAIGPAGNG